MELLKQVPTLELCQQLKAAGYPQEDSWFVWLFDHAFHPAQWVALEKRFLTEQERANLSGWRAAPTVAELGEALPDQHASVRIQGKWYGEGPQEGQIHCGNHESTEANVRALVWLNRNGRIAPK
jgi:hypothetical protein